MNTLRTAVVIWSVVAGLGAVIAWIRLDRAVRNDVGARLSFAAALSYAGCAALSGMGLLPQPNLPQWWAWTVAPLGLLMLLMGQALGMWARRTLAGSFSPRLAPAAGSGLVTAGPYRICRHPIMLGFLMTWIGTAVMLGSPSMCIAFGFIAILIMRRVALEEECLEAAFGSEYARYRESVPLITPCVDPRSEEAKEIEKAVAMLRGNCMIGRCSQ